MEFREGDRVAYIGPEVDGGRIGDEGTIVSSAGSDASHVVWTSGHRTGAVTLVTAYDLTPATSQREASISNDHLVDDSLEYGPLVTFSARKVYDEAGSLGLVTAMADEGHLANLAGYADDLLSHFESKVREDTSVQTVLSDLDTDEADALVSLTANMLMRDAFEEDEDGAT